MHLYDVTYVNVIRYAVISRSYCGSVKEC